MQELSRSSSGGADASQTPKDHVVPPVVDPEGILRNNINATFHMLTATARLPDPTHIQGHVIFRLSRSSLMDKT